MKYWFIVFNINLWLSVAAFDTRLGPDARPRSARIKVDEIHSYNLALEAGDLVRGSLQYRDLNPIIFGESEDMSWQLNSTIFGHGRETFWIRGEKGKHFTLKLKASETPLKGGRYTLTLTWLRDAAEAPAHQAFLLQNVEPNHGKLEQALKIWRQRKDVEQQARNLIQRAMLEDKQGRTELALKTLAETDTLNLSKLAPDLHALISYRKADYLSRGLNEEPEGLGPLRLAQTEQAYQRALTLATKVRDPLLAGRIHNDLGYYFQVRGKSYEALEHFEQALKFFERQPFPLLQSRTHSLRAKTLSFSGKISEARQDLNQALTFSRAGAGRKLEAIALFELGWSYSLEKRYDEAIECYQQAILLRKALGHQEAMAALQDRLGTAYRESNRPELALACYHKALAFYGQNDKPLMCAIVETNVATTLYLQGQLEAALKLCNKLLPIFRREQPTRMEDALLLAAHISRRLKGPAAALPFLKEAHEGINQLCRDSKSRQLMRGVGASRFKHLAAYVDVLLELGQEEKAILLLDNARSRWISATLNLSQDERRTHLDLRDSLVENYFEDPGHSSQLPLRQLDLVAPIDLDQLSPSFSLTQIRKALMSDDQSVVWFFALDEETSRLWFLERDQFQLFHLPGQEAIQKLVSEVIQLSEVSYKKTKTGPWFRAINQLSAMLAEPLAALPAEKRLVIVGDGLLANAPFSALSVSGTATPDAYHPLIEERSVVFAPSLAMASRLRQSKIRSTAPTGSVVIFADAVSNLNDERLAKGSSVQKSGAGVSRFESLPRLRYSSAEALEIAALAPSKTQLQLGFEATRSAFFATDWRQYQILHLSCHGLLDPVPEMSGLVLSRYDAKGRAQDGYLTSLDLGAMELPLELAVLSACRSATGEDKIGQGLWGFSIAMLESGCTRLVASSWNVQEKPTAALFGQFYRKLLVENLDPDEALRRAQLHLFKQTAWKAPYYWASWMFLGDWRGLPQ